jgi:outer membrane PBP1 activator LpoA protein
MRALLVTATVCLLAACSNTQLKTTGPATDSVLNADPLSIARAHNQHWLNPHLVADFPAGTDSDYRPPARLAILLPQTGSLGIAGNAIRDGILSAYYTETRNKPSIRFYNSQGSVEGSKLAYQRALKDGAQMIIGPIGKDEVTAVAELADNIPVLVLNKVMHPNNKFLLNFSLAPEREGELLAERLLANNLKQTALFYQASESNARTLLAFEQAYQQAGGTVLAKTIMPMLAKDETAGTATYPALPNNLQQAKALVFLMSGTAAKSTRRALSLQDADHLPIFASSDIIDNADPKTNAQLDGIEFLQMPWLSGQANALGIKPLQLKTLPSARSGGSRLNAFGVDVWLISTHLHAWLANPNQAVNGATGILHLEPDGQIAGKLTWSIFQNGLPQTSHASQP